MKPIKTCRVCDVVLVKGSGVTNPKGNCYSSNMELGKRICNSCFQAYSRKRESIRRKVKQVNFQKQAGKPSKRIKDHCLFRSTKSLIKTSN